MFYHIHVFLEHRKMNMSLLWLAWDLKVTNYDSTK